MTLLSGALLPREACYLPPPVTVSFLPSPVRHVCTQRMYLDKYI